jgi:phosphohistidine phosphatase
LLIRHAKTEQGSPDVQRALTGRGRRDAAALGEWLRANDLVPDHVVVSPAVRSQQTWRFAAEAMGAEVAVSVDDRIYSNDVDGLVEVVRELPESAEVAALVGHNPSIQELVAAWTPAGEASYGVDPHRNFPTTSVAAFAVDGEWAEVGATALRPIAIETLRG